MHMSDNHSKSSASSRVRILPGQTKDSLRVIDVSLSACRRNPNQPRKVFDEPSLRELAASIEQHGLLQPITVKRDPKNKQGFVIVAGERRFRALELLGRETIPAVVTSGKTDEIALIENLQREDLNPLEEAQALQKLKEKYGYTHEELGQAVGKARTTITNLLKLNDLPKKIKDECLTSNIASRSLLLELTRIDNPKKQLSLWKEAKERGVTIREARLRQQGKEQQLASDSQRTVTMAKRLVTDLERLANNAATLDKDKYEDLLDVYKRFVAIIEKIGTAQGKAKAKR
jgi:ParB family transcriptional regulator, chromosome partitioning protein